MVPVAVGLQVADPAATLQTRCCCSSKGSSKALVEPCFKYKRLCCLGFFCSRTKKDSKKPDMSRQGDGYGDANMRAVVELAEQETNTDSEMTGSSSKSWRV